MRSLFPPPPPAARLGGLLTGVAPLWDAGSLLRILGLISATVYVDLMSYLYLLLEEIVSVLSGTLLDRYEMDQDLESPVTTGKMQFLDRESYPKTEKPYTLLYFPNDSLPMTNFKYSDVRAVPIRDMRPNKGKLSLDEEGFVAADFASSLKYEEFYNEESLKSTLIPEVHRFLADLLGTKATFVHECVVCAFSKIPDSSKTVYLTTDTQSGLQARRKDAIRQAHSRGSHR